MEGRCFGPDFAGFKQWFPFHLPKTIKWVIFSRPLFCNSQLGTNHDRAFLDSIESQNSGLTFPNNIGFTDHRMAENSAAAQVFYSTIAHEKTGLTNSAWPAVATAWPRRKHDLSLSLALFVLFPFFPLFLSLCPSCFQGNQVKRN